MLAISLGRGPIKGKNSTRDRHPYTPAVRKARPAAREERAPARRLRRRDVLEAENKRNEEEEEVPVEASWAVVDPLPSREARLAAMESDTTQLRDVEDDLTEAANALQLDSGAETEACPPELQLRICSGSAQQE
ncbi:uncharacterized protein N7484_006713 [Penicillium longicatenatum]|uniref:uncharacterized protein n=1 Tax=Penicillium longicatenatum TaxID=1561947 RepID=UPI00254920B1|nr:uncharacterized protein N7484_006713 [Penicillium longicatenatum]KAJ5644206.1 hypothetical protein N7484_006713 [Penicillium longicatenatum]